MAGIDVSGLGSFIRDQRDQAEMSLRQLAKAAEVSNPYLSQVERGLRKPSAEILNRIAQGSGFLRRPCTSKLEFSAIAPVTKWSQRRSPRIEP